MPEPLQSAIEIRAIEGEGTTIHLRLTGECVEESRP
jgi:hypothetical protein